MNWMIFTGFHFCALQLILSYNATDCNLQGDLGNTPLILACSINNCEALSILVRTSFSRANDNFLSEQMTGRPVGFKLIICFLFLLTPPPSGRRLNTEPSCASRTSSAISPCTPPPSQAQQKPWRSF